MSSNPFVNAGARISVPGAVGQKAPNFGQKGSQVGGHEALDAFLTDAQATRTARSAPGSGPFAGAAKHTSSGAGRRRHGRRPGSAADASFDVGDPFADVLADPFADTLAGFDGPTRAERSHPAAGSTAHRRANRHGRAKSQGGNAAFGGARSGASTYRQGGATNGASGARRAGAAAGAGVGVGAGAGVPMVDTDGTGNYAGAQDEFGGVGGATTFSRNNATHRSPMHAHESPRSRVDSRATSGGEVEFAAGAQPQLGVGEEATLGRGRSGSGAGDAAFEDGQAAALRTIMAHPDVEAFLYELEISDDEIEDEAAAQPTFAMKLPEKPDRRRRKSVIGRRGVWKPRYRLEEGDEEFIGDRLMKGKMLLRAIAFVPVAVATLRWQLFRKQLKTREQDAAALVDMLNMYVDICKVWMGRKCQKPVVSLLEPDINVDFTANRSKNPMRALMFWKNTAQTGLGEKVMKVKVRLKGLLDRLLDAVNANDGFPKQMLKFLRHLTLDGNYFPPKYFFHCEATDPETKYTLSSIAGTTHMRDFVTIRPGDVVPSEEWALKHQEELQGEPQLMDQAQKGRLAARLKEIVAELNERADMSDDTNSDADFERLQYERDQIERFLKEASAREAAILGDARVIGDISKCEMVIGTFIIGRIVIPSVVASPWTSGMCKEPGRRGKRNTAVLASLVWRLFFQIYKPGFKPGLHASATGGDEDAHRASSAIGRVSSTMGLEGHEETKGTDGAESRQEKRSPSMAEPATRTPLRAPSRLLRFKSRGGILGTLAGGIAAGLGQQDNDESSDEEVEREWLTEKQIAAMMLPHRYFRPVEPLLDDFMWLMEERLRLFIRLLTLRVIVTLRDKPKS